MAGYSQGGSFPDMAVVERKRLGLFYVTLLCLLPVSFMTALPRFEVKVYDFTTNQLLEINHADSRLSSFESTMTEEISVDLYNHHTDLSQIPLCKESTVDHQC